MKIIIPASGIGKRFIDAGYKQTKPLIDVTPEKKIIDYVIDAFDKENDEFFIITSRATSEQMSEYLKTANINYTHITIDESKLGPVGAIKEAKDQLLKSILPTDEVIVSYCDYGIEWNYADFLDFIKDEQVEGIIPVYSGFHPHLKPENVYAACKVEGDTITQVIEKYKSDDRYSELWSPGLYYFKHFSNMMLAFTRMINAKDSLNGEYYVSLSYNYLSNTKKVYNKVTKFYQFGTPTDFQEAKEAINKREKIINLSSIIKNTIILSAGKGERFLNLSYKQPKPFLPLGDSDLVTKISDSFKNVKTDVLCVGSDAHSVFWENSQYKYKLIPSNKLGGAVSYINACENLEGETLIVPCDLIAQHITSEFNKVKQDADAIIFTTSPSNFALENEDSFAWVNGGVNNEILDISIKQRRPRNDMVLIGSFWVKDNSILIESIHDIIRKNFTVNDEYYLDNAFFIMKHNGYKVKFVKLDKYFSLGTPEEYNLNKYWLEGSLK